MQPYRVHQSALTSNRISPTLRRPSCSATPPEQISFTRSMLPLVPPTKAKPRPPPSGLVNSTCMMQLWTNHRRKMLNGEKEEEMQFQFENTAQHRECRLTLHLGMKQHFRRCWASISGGTQTDWEGYGWHSEAYIVFLRIGEMSDTFSCPTHSFGWETKKIKDSGFSYLVWKRRTVKMEQTRKIRIWKKVDILNYISAISNFGNKQRAKEREKKNHRAHKPPATVVILRETCWRLCLAYDRWTRSVLSEWPSTLSPTIACTVTRQLSNLPDRPRIALSVHEHVRACVWVCAHVIAIVLQSNTPVEVQRLANY